MIAELIAVGTELLLGSIANTDAQMIYQRPPRPWTRSSVWPGS